MAQILFVAFDQGPKCALSIVAERLRESILADGIEKFPTSADAVVIGLSSSQNAGVEHAAADYARERNIPLAVFADTFGAWRREWFASIREQVKLLFVSSRDEVAEASDFFPLATVIAVGNPMWDEYLLPPVLDRTDARDSIGVSKEYVVFLPGTKNFGRNSEMLHSLLGAVNAVPDGKRDEVLVVYGKHPGDKNDANQYEKIAEVFPDVAFRLLPEQLRTDDILAGLDVVAHPANSSVGLHALMRGIPVVTVPFISLDEYITNECAGWDYVPCSLRPESIPELSVMLAQRLVGVAYGPWCTLPHDLKNLEPRASLNSMISALRAL